MGWGRRPNAVYAWVRKTEGPNKGKLYKRYFKDNAEKIKVLTSKTYGMTKEAATSAWLGVGQDAKEYILDVAGRMIQREVTRMMTRALPISKARNKGFLESTQDAMKRMIRREAGRAARKTFKKATEPISQNELNEILKEMN